MKEYRIFLASSIEEFRQDRVTAGNFIRRVNDALHFGKVPIYLRLFECELEDASITPEHRKQDEYNRFIQDCDLFWVLFCQKAGQFTLEELKHALKYKRKITVFFRVDGSGASKTARNKVSAITQGKKIASKEYRSVFQFQWLLLEQLQQNGLQDHIRLEDNAAYVCGQNVL